MTFSGTTMDVEIVQEPRGMAYFINPGLELNEALVQHMPPIVLCLVIAFVVRRQAGEGWLVLGAGLLLFRELFCLLASQSIVFSALEGIGPGIVVPLMHGTLILGFGFVGIGIMQPFKGTLKDESRLARWLNAMLFISVSIELFMLFNRLSMLGNDALINSAQEAFHMLSLALLIAVVSFRQIYHSQLSRNAADSQRQLDAMISMFATVKHDLNNDMQVVMGNAELADMLITAGGDIQKPVNNITHAANVAIERIEQLSIFNSSSKPSLSAIDLNATLRECVARLENELPAIVTLKMELEHLPIRVLADKHILSLSLVNLIRQALKNMQHGGEVVIKTHDLTTVKSTPGNAVVSAEVVVVRALGLPIGGENSSPASTDKAVSSESELEIGFDITKSLIERSGGISVAHSLSPNEYLFNMGFVSEPAVESSTTGLRYANEYPGC